MQVGNKFRAWNCNFPSLQEIMTDRPTGEHEVLQGSYTLTRHLLFQVEVDQFTEKLAVAQLEQKSKEDAVMAAEAEFNRLNRLVEEEKTCRSDYGDGRRGRLYR